MINQFSEGFGLICFILASKIQGSCELQLVILPDVILAKNVKISRFKSGMIKKFYKKLEGGNNKLEINIEQENARQIEVIKAVKDFKPELTKDCYSVGLWIWAEFNQRLNQEEVDFLKEIGFRWNKSRKVWQNACGVKSRSSATDPRAKYQIIRFD